MELVEGQSLRQIRPPGDVETSSPKSSSAIQTQSGSTSPRRTLVVVAYVVRVQNPDLMGTRRVQGETVGRGAVPEKTVCRILIANELPSGSDCSGLVAGQDVRVCLPVNVRAAC